MNIYKSTFILFPIVILLIMVLTILNGYVLNNLQSNGIQYAKLQNQINEIEFKNAQLEYQIIKSESFITIASRAASQGFIEPK